MIHGKSPNNWVSGLACYYQMLQKMDFVVPLLYGKFPEAMPLRASWNWRHKQFPDGCSLFLPLRLSLFPIH